jgi:hypothetical protein
VTAESDITAKQPRESCGEAGTTVYKLNLIWREVTASELAAHSQQNYDNEFDLVTVTDSGDPDVVESYS